MLKNDKNATVAIVNEILDEIYILFPNAHCELNYNNIFELAVATILSAQTTDKSVNKVTPNLFSKYPNPMELANAKEEDVLQIIKSIGLSKTKSKNIVAFSKKVHEQFNDVVPNDFELLQTLPGVGRKTANVILTEGYKVPRIPVDTHVDRVSKRLQIASETDSVLEVEKKLMSLIPKANWHLAHHLLLFFGRYHCFSRNPKCDNCKLKKYCKYNIADKNPLI